jgi:membrane associated rhomboid family serine protease
MVTCFHHTDRETGRACTRCGRPACPDCLHQASVGSQCWECIKAAQPPRVEQVRRAWAGVAMPFFNTVVLLNAVVFVLTLGGYGNTGERRVIDFAVNAPDVASGEWYRIITAGFIHFGALHIALNMFALYQVCRLFESQLGSTRFAWVYAASLFAGSLGALIFDPDKATGGASGAVLGMFGAVAAAMYQRGMSFWNTGFGPYLVIVMAWSFFDGNVSFGGHLGGIIGGAIVGWFMFAAGETRKLVKPTVGIIVAVVVGVGSFVGALAIADSKADDVNQRLYRRCVAENVNRQVPRDVAEDFCRDLL